MAGGVRVRGEDGDDEPGKTRRERAWWARLMVQVRGASSAEQSDSGRGRPAVPRSLERSGQEVRLAHAGGQLEEADVPVADDPELAARPSVLAAEVGFRNADDVPG